VSTELKLLYKSVEALLLSNSFWFGRKGIFMNDRMLCKWWSKIMRNSAKTKRDQKRNECHVTPDLSLQIKKQSR
jgi:hypothetical protein